jgi:hypothetical protein
MNEVKISECYRKNLCVDCDNTECLHCGDTMADCPKYGCDNNKQDDCEHCDFIKQYQTEMREQYRKIWKVGDDNGR